MANNIIQSNQGIVMVERQVTLTDEKLSGILLRTYEKAVADVTKWKYYNLYSVLLSVAGTLFFSLLTSEFYAIGPIKADTVKNTVILLTIISAILGFVFLGISVNQKKKSDTEVRDESINEIIIKYSEKGEQLITK